MWTCDPTKAKGILGGYFWGFMSNASLLFWEKVRKWLLSLQNRSKEMIGKRWNLDLEQRQKEAGSLRTPPGCWINCSCSPLPPPFQWYKPTHGVTDEPLWNLGKFISLHIELSVCDGELRAGFFVVIVWSLWSPSPSVLLVYFEQKHPEPCLKVTWYPQLWRLWR